MKAFVIDSTDTAGRVDRQRAVPVPRADQLLVKPTAVALNPTDWRSVTTKGRAKPGCTVGCDYAGVVVAVGEEAARQNKWKAGDRVFGCAHGSNPANTDDGVFAEYATVSADLQMRLLPESGLDFEAAATLSLGAMTVGQGLFQTALQLELPDAATAANPPPRDTPVLIYGGGTATGALGIQFAHRAGYTVVTTCSPENFDYVKSLGAAHVVDYHDADAGQQIRAWTKNKLYHAWDTVSVAQSAQICADALSTDVTQQTPKYGSILLIQCPRDDVQSAFTIMYTVFGKVVKYGDKELPPSADDFAFGKQFFALTEALVAAGLIKPHTYRVEKGGLDGIAEGLEKLRLGKVRAEKLVYRLADTA